MNFSDRQNARRGFYCSVSILPCRKDLSGSGAIRCSSTGGGITRVNTCRCVHGEDGSDFSGVCYPRSVDVVYSFWSSWKNSELVSRSDFFESVVVGQSRKERGVNDERVEELVGSKQAYIQSAGIRNTETKTSSLDDRLVDNLG